MHLPSKLFLLVTTLAPICASAFERINYNRPNLDVDLGVGLWAWPMPMDWDGDGDYDLVVVCPGKPYNGTYFFENPDGDVAHPVFKKAVRVSRGLSNTQVSYVDDEVFVTVGGSRNLKPTRVFKDFIGNGLQQGTLMNYPLVDVGEGRIRAAQWKFVDFDGDGDLDLSFGVGFWGDYGWDDAYNEKGEWTNGPLRGYIYIYNNTGSTEAPEYEAAYKLEADGQPVDVYGMPSPNFEDFDGDGDLDLICGEFLDGFTYFENIGTRQSPNYTNRGYLTEHGKKLRMYVQMITPVAIDWDKDGDIDLIVGDEDGRVALVENTGELVDSKPQFLSPVYFQQSADEVKFGALATPFSVDWDGDGDEDLIAGNTAGNIGFIENLSGGENPQWAAPVLLRAGGQVIHLQAGENGSIQGPAEAKWGYTVLNVADWNHDGLLDIVTNGIFGKIEWYENEGSREAPRLKAAQTVQVEWEGAAPKPAWNWWDPEGNDLVTQWRTTPNVVDWNGDGLNDLVMVDYEGYLAFYQRERRGDELVLLPGQRIFKGDSFDNGHVAAKSRVDGNHLLRLNNESAGRSGRRKTVLVDWDLDGDLDLLVNSDNANFIENVGTVDGMTEFVDRGMVSKITKGGHSSSPTIVDWNKDGIPDLLLGVEDGFFYYLENPNK